MNTEHPELYRHLRNQFGSGSFSRQSAEILASRCGEVSEAIDILIQEGHLEIRGSREELALTRAAS